jgi:hypothetical protein
MYKIQSFEQCLVIYSLQVLSSTWGFEIQSALCSCAVGLLVKASAHLWYVRLYSIVWQPLMQQTMTMWNHGGKH